MRNHVHLLLGLRHASKSLNTIISNGKRFDTYELVKRLQKKGEDAVLHKLAAAVSPSDKRRGKLHQVFTPSFDCKECRSKKFIVQKSEYIHANPCSGKWSLALSPIDYLHSSARFYYCGEHSSYAVTSYKELEDIDLTSTAG